MIGEKVMSDFIGHSEIRNNLSCEKNGSISIARFA